ncbi:hypothetical protein A2454_04615 [Candidatus Peribacteria bacterium RIFOXYC2_FULL_55_14]|nr:MAG: Cytochrome c biogenesis protein [Candidatus Peribacteria bacterium GW2011_GWB1_54_5]KKW44420.1 MAG: Cytochrome c biogenesis protein [Candidatus Peregrinibacteria bacterium GW2011_GWA2_54_9]OGJ75179.1 MAG: hypothetical protein A2217_05625 [Candidatus Peribacteria bacterium RIFOXYA2_FULL_55_28]OGJ80565.1 MAG: hypothetical protein A2454_04615 [Candidatus Peribacteria bacterium RIFOXYC2_FULL_55_14]
MRVKNFFPVTIAFASVVGALIFLPHAYAQENIPVDLVLFYGQGCPHCARAINWLDEVGEKYSQLNTHQFEIYFAKENIPLFQRIAQEYGQDIGAVPTIFIGEEAFVGFGGNLQAEVESEIVRCLNEGCPSPLRFVDPERVANVQAEDLQQSSASAVSVIAESSVERGAPMGESVSSAFIEQENSNANEGSTGQNMEVEEGRNEIVEEDAAVNLANAITIPAVVGGALVDAINPCEFAVLIILITTILVSGKKRRALFAGLAFSLSIFISYFLMGVGLYSAIQASGFTHTFYLVIAILAIFIGLFNLKDYLWYGKWFVMEVPMSWRPRLKALIRSVTSVPGAFFIGFVVSLFLLPCTSGPYIVVLGLLAHTTTRGYALALLTLYNLIFVSPMILITFAVYFGFTTTDKAEECRMKCLKTLHLIAGLIILCLGFVMLGSVLLGYV